MRTPPDPIQQLHLDSIEHHPDNADHDLMSTMLVLLPVDNQHREGLRPSLPHFARLQPGGVQTANEDYDGLVGIPSRFGSDLRPVCGGEDAFVSSSYAILFVCISWCRAPSGQERISHT